MAITADILLRETLVSRIHDSRDKLTALAMIPAEAALLAAQQVQNIRLSDVEAPKDVGWGELAFEFLLSFVINSSFVEKLSAKLFSKVFGRLIAQQQCLDAFETKFNEKFLDDLIKAEDQAARAGTPALGKALKQAASPSGTGVLKTVAGVPPSPAAVQAAQLAVQNLTSAETAFAKELGRVANLPPVKQTQMVPYANGISDVLSRLDKKDAASFVKATKDVSKKGGVPKKSTIAAQDTAGVGIVEHFMAAAAAQRLHVCALHNRFEWLVRILPLQSETMALVAGMFDRSLLDDMGSDPVDLDDLRSDLKRRIEALIWSVHLGFDQSRHRPDIIFSRTTEYDCIVGVKERITKYLFDRFGDLAESRVNARGNQLQWDRLNTGPKAKYLRDYFWALAASIAN